MVCYNGKTWTGLQSWIYTPKNYCGRVSYTFWTLVFSYVKWRCYSPPILAKLPWGWNRMLYAKHPLLCIICVALCKRELPVCHSKALEELSTIRISNWGTIATTRNWLCAFVPSHITDHRKQWYHLWARFQCKDNLFGNSTALED